jgi:tripartite-type tricarboxylate transporter receptor subunit TctC
MGNGPALVDVVGGQLDTMFNTLAISLSLVQSGKLRALAVAGEHRSKLAPDLPTVSEAGLPGFSFVGWYGIVAPAGTPHAVVRRLNEALVQVVKSPDMTQRILNQGNEPVGSTPEEFDRFIREEIPKWAKVIKDARITLAP